MLLDLDHNNIYRDLPVGMTGLNLKYFFLLSEFEVLEREL